MLSAPELEVSGDAVVLSIAGVLTGESDGEPEFDGDAEFEGAAASLLPQPASSDSTSSAESSRVRSFLPFIFLFPSFFINPILH